MTTKLFTIPQRLKLLKNIIVISLIFSFCLSYKLWLSERFFPTTPLIHLNINFKIDGLLTILSCLCLGMSLFFKYERLLILISVLINTFSDYPFMHLLYSQLLVCQRVCLQNTVCLICK